MSVRKEREVSPCAARDHPRNRGARVRLHRLRRPASGLGRHKIDFSVLPPEWIELFRTGTDLEIQWLTTLAARARRFRAKVPS